MDAEKCRLGPRDLTDSPRAVQVQVIGIEKRLQPCKHYVSSYVYCLHYHLNI